MKGNLANIGLLKGFAPWVLVLAHGSMGRNNPFLSGYQCGACGGQRGGINARVFCAFANDPAVRAILRDEGVDIPEADYPQLYTLDGAIRYLLARSASGEAAAAAPGRDPGAPGGA